MKCIMFLILFSLLVSCNSDVIVNPSENFSQSDIIDIYANQESLNILLNNRMFNTEISVELIYKGIKHNVLMRASGAGSRYHPKWSYRIIMQHNDQIEGLSEFNLSAQVFDKTFLNTTIASKIYRDNGFEVFDSKHIFLRINGEDIGLYLLIEKIDTKFFSERNINVNELFKLGFGSQFTFTSPNFPEFHFDKEMPDDDNFSSLREFIYAVDTSNTNTIYSSLGKFLNIDQYLKYHAITTIVNNYDAFSNNFYLLKKNPNAPFEILPWDFDKVFESDNVINSIYGENDLIKKLFSADSTRKKYLQIFENKLSILDLNYLEPIIDSTASNIKEAYNADPLLGNGRYNFDQEILKLKDYIQHRKNYLRTLLEEYN